MPRHINLDAASLSIDKFLKAHTSLSTAEMQFLLSIKNTIVVLDKANTGWVKKDGVVAKSKTAAGGQPISQAVMNQEAASAQLQVINFFLIILKSLEKQLDEKIQNKAAEQSSAFCQLLKEIKIAIEGNLKHLQVCGVLSDTKLPETAKLKRVQLPDEQKKYFGTPLDIYLLCTLFGGSYYMMKQKYDVMYGRPRDEKGEWIASSGMCKGALMVWTQEVETMGCFESLRSAINETAYEFQYDQSKMKFKTILTFPINTFLMMDNVLAKLSSDHIYACTLSGNNTPHIVGIRKTVKNQIEFFDANFGVFVFPEANNFAYWFNLFLGITYSEYLEIELKEIGRQPKNAIASIGVANDPDSVMPFGVYIKERALPSVFVCEEKLSSATDEDIHQKALALDNSFLRHLSPLLSEVSPRDLVEYEQRCMAARDTAEVIFLKKVAKKLEVKEQIDEKKWTVYRKAQVECIHAALKKQVIQEINKELERLKNCSVGDETAKLRADALGALVVEVHGATAFLTMQGVIDKWLKSKTKGKSNKVIVHTGRYTASVEPTKTELFLDSLYRNFEISLFRVMLFQSVLCDKLVNVIFSESDTLKRAPIYKLIFLPLRDKLKKVASGAVTSRDLLAAMREWSIAFKLADAKDALQVDFLSVLRKVQIDDVVSLHHAFGFYNKYQAFYNLKEAANGAKQTAAAVGRPN